MEKLKISIVEDDTTFQAWIKQALFDTDIECISAHTDGEEALAAIPYHRPDIVLMDLTLEKSKYSGIECILRLRINWPKLKFLVLSANSDEYKIFEALRVGAGAYIHKEEIEQDDLAKIIYELHHGGAPMSPGIAKRVLSSIQQQPADLLRLQELTAKEEQVLKQLSRGKLYKEVAYMLGITENTVKQHAHNIYQKLQVNSCVEAVRKYFNLW